MIAGANVDNEAKEVSAALELNFGEDVVRVDRALNEDEEVLATKLYSALVPFKQVNRSIWNCPIGSHGSGSSGDRFDLRQAYLW